jgi:hypothetical protein
MMSETSWFQRLTRATFDVLVPLLNTVAPDLGRQRSFLLKIPILVDRHLMSAPTYSSCSYVVNDDVIRIPERFPIHNKSVVEWCSFIGNNISLNSMLGLHQKPVADHPTSANTSDRSSEASEEGSDDEDMQPELLESVPASMIDNASQYEALVNDEHYQNMINVAAEYVCLLHFFLIIGPHCRVAKRARVVLHSIISPHHSSSYRLAICYRDDAAQYLGADCARDATDSSS